MTIDDVKGLRDNILEIIQIDYTDLRKTNPDLFVTKNGKEYILIGEGEYHPIKPKGDNVIETYVDGSLYLDPQGRIPILKGIGHVDNKEYFYGKLTVFIEHEGEMYKSLYQPVEGPGKDFELNYYPSHNDNINPLIHKYILDYFENNFPEHVI